MKSCLRVCVLIVLLMTDTVLAQTYDTVRVATYNILNYSNSDSATRNPALRRVLWGINPDILVVQEMISAAGQAGFLNNVLNAGRPNTYAAAPFSDGYDTDNSMFYKTTKFSFVGPQTVLHTALRDINGYRLRPLGISADSLDIQIYVAHLKASQGYENQRGVEADTLRTHLNGLPDGGHFIAAGDFNLYASTEPAFVNLTGSQSDNSGRLYDPLATPGNWHDGTTFAGVHTQATRSSDGGLDDRFDFLLLGSSFQTLPGWEYTPGSYTEYGNDGNHLNQSINVLPNGAVPDSIANALFTAADHLPVFLQIRRLHPSAATIALLSPNGGETWTVGLPGAFQWSSNGLSGNVRIEINRSYPSTIWTTLFGSAVNDGSESWAVTGPATAHARIRIYGVNMPTIGDTSAADFSIAASSPPAVAHDRHGDAYPGSVVFTARITDDLAGVSAMLFYRNVAALGYDSLAMTVTGFPSEHSASPTLSHGRWVYYVRASDTDGQTTSTPAYAITVAPDCGLSLAYDDSSAERFDCAAESTVWAVRFTPLQTPFVLSQASVSVAGFYPDSAHTSIRVRVLAANGPNGMPGTLLREVARGSIGNVVGGLPSPGAYEAYVMLSDDSLPPLTFNSDFYVAVLNGNDGEEAFAIDTSSSNANRSVLFDAATQEWYPDDGSVGGIRGGNRMIGVKGWVNQPPQLVASCEGDGLRLSWTSMGSAYYKIFKSLSDDFSVSQLIATVSDTTTLLDNEVNSQLISFYRVISSSTP